jgi:cobaltochelatase CobT
MADAAALSLRYHNPQLHSKHAPADRSARAIFDAAEQARIEAIGTLQLPGVAQNLNVRLERYCLDQGYDITGEARPVPPLADVVSLLVREQLTGLAAPASTQGIMEKWGKWISLRASSQLKALAHTLHDQATFSEHIRHLIQLLDTDGANDAREDTESEPEKSENENSDEQGENNNVESLPSGSLSGVSSDDTDSSRKRQPIKAGLASQDQQEGASDSDEGTSESDTRFLPNWDEGIEPSFHYKAFTTAFDEIVRAEELCSAEELTKLRSQLDHKLSGLQDITRKLAHRLQRKLLAQQNRSWEFDREEGILDSARLSSVIADPMFPYIYKWEKDIEQMDTVVTLLLDNSGSMRGRPITVAALSADILACTLERCGIKVEILGFTSRDWKGGDSRKQWEKQGNPQNPGRLNDLRHIIYKSADQPWRRARKNLGLMLREGILKENIDGEAILWAHDRLLARPEKRAILMVISDGAPVDDSTLSTNTAHYLDRHLREVIATVEARSPVELVAIGIGHDVTRYYRKAVTIRDVDQLGDTMFGQLEQLFDRPLRAA